MGWNLPSDIRYLIPAIGLVLVMATPPLASWWESSMVRHMLVQIPSLVAAGVLLSGPVARRFPEPPESHSGTGAPLVLIGFVTLGFWMLPRWLDAAVNHPGTDVAKIVSLVLVSGLPLGLGWRRLGSVGRAFVVVQLVSMLLILGVLYLTFPDRLCNNYLVSEQTVLGRLTLLLAAAIGLWGAGRVLFAAPRAPATEVPQTPVPGGND